MKYMNLIALSLVIIPHAMWAHEHHEHICVSAKVLDTHLELIVYHPTDDPKEHYINHVKVIRGSVTIFDQDFDDQTDTYSLDIEIPHPAKSARKRVKKGERITVHASCNQDEESHGEIIVH